MATKVLRRLSSKKVRGPIKNKTEPLLFDIPFIDETTHPRGIAFVTACIAWLRENKAHEYKDILKIEPNQKSLLDLTRLVEKQAINNHYEIPKEEDPNIVAFLLRSYFLQMKEPIFTFQAYNHFIGACSHQEPAKVTKYLRSALGLLPKNNFSILRILFLYLHELALGVEVTGTSADDLGIVFGTSLLRPKVETTILMIGDATHIAGVITKLILEVNYIFQEIDEKEQKKSEAFQNKMQRLYSSNVMVNLQQLSNLKETEQIDNKTFRSTLNTIGGQLHRGDQNALKMLLENGADEEKVPSRTSSSTTSPSQKSKRMSRGRTNRSSKVSTDAPKALRIQVRKVAQTPTSDAVPMISRLGPENIPHDNTDMDIAQEMSMILGQIYGAKEEKTQYNDNEKEEMRNILKAIYLS